jgi:hypothetical protein
MNSYNTMFTRDMVCLGNMSVDTLNRGDIEDNNNNNDFDIQRIVHRDIFFNKTNDMH